MVLGSKAGGVGLGVRMLPLAAPGASGPSMWCVFSGCVGAETCGPRRQRGWEGADASYADTRSWAGFEAHGGDGDELSLYTAKVAPGSLSASTRLLPNQVGSLALLQGSRDGAL
jgi:hypothetical protein